MTTLTAPIPNLDSMSYQELRRYAASHGMTNNRLSKADLLAAMKGSLRAPPAPAAEPAIVIEPKKKRWKRRPNGASIDSAQIYSEDENAVIGIVYSRARNSSMDPWRGIDYENNVRLILAAPRLYDTIALLLSNKITREQAANVLVSIENEGLVA